MRTKYKNNCVCQPVWTAFFFLLLNGCMIKIIHTYMYEYKNKKTDNKIIDFYTKTKNREVSNKED